MVGILVPVWAWPIAVVISLISIVCAVIKCCRLCKDDKEKQQVDPQSLISVDQPQRIIIYTRVASPRKTQPEGNASAEAIPNFEDKASTEGNPSAEAKPSAEDTVGIESNTDTRPEEPRRAARIIH